MPSTFTQSGVELIGDGEQSGAWGTTTNTNLQIIDRMVSQAGAITLSGTTHTLTISDGVLSDGQYGVLVFGGVPTGTNTVTISPNDAQRIYIAKNDSGESVVLTQGSGGNVTVADGKTAIIYCDGAGSGAAVVDLTADLAVTALTLADFGITASAAELNILDGVTASTAELNILDGVTASTAELNILDGVTATFSEINLLDGVTWTLTDYNTLTASATELNLLDGVTALTGADNVLVTGTAGADGQLAQWNADGDVVGVDKTLAEATWETGTDTTESLVSPAKVKAAIDEYAIGIGQTWQDVSGSRSTGTSYQNTTGKPIQVAVSVETSGTQYFQVSSNNSTWINVAFFSKNAGDNTQTNAQIIVPNNYYYRIPSASVNSIDFWAELR